MNVLQHLAAPPAPTVLRRDFLKALTALPCAAALAFCGRASSAVTLAVRSKDGTSIASFCEGSGPSLLLVHGGFGDHTRWNPIVPDFAARFHVCAMDRRGHGASGDGPGYAFQREFEDVVAVINSLAPPVGVVGHSIGAIFAAEAAFLTLNVSRLVLYEPPFPVEGPVTDPAVLVRIEERIGAKEDDAALEIFLREVVKLSEARIADARKSSGWPVRVATLGPLARQLHALNAYSFDQERFHNLKIPTLLVMGSETAGHHRAAILALDRVLPNHKLVVLKGQEHNAIETAPELFASTVLDFLSGVH